MSQQQYSSPKIWGPHFWYMLRCIAHNYPLKPSSDDAEHVKTFFNELQYLLPCELCKYTFRQHFTKYPIDKGLINKASLIEWVETIYQETKKVIQDKRIKILDIYEEIDEVKPIKIAYKPKIDPIEEQLNEMRRNVMKKDNYSRAIQLPPAIQDTRSIRSSHSLHKQNNKNQTSQKSSTKQINERKTFKINDQPLSPIDKINVGKKSELEPIRKYDSHETLVIQNKVDPGFGKITSGKKMEFDDSIKKVASRVVFSDYQQNVSIKSPPNPTAKPEPQLPIPQIEPFKLQPLPIQKPRQKLQSPRNTVLKFESPQIQPITQIQPLKLELPKQQPNVQPSTSTSTIKLELVKPQSLNLFNEINQINQINQNSQHKLAVDIIKNTEPLKKQVITNNIPNLPKHNILNPVSYVNKKQNDLERQIRAISNQKYVPPRLRASELILTRKCKKCDH